MCLTGLWNSNVRKQVINDALPGSVATYLKCAGVVNNQIKKGLLLSLPVKKLKSVNIWQSYKQEGSCLVHFVCLATTLLKDEESAQHIPPFAHNYAIYSQFLKKSLMKSAVNLS